MAQTVIEKIVQAHAVGLDPGQEVHAGEDLAFLGAGSSVLSRQEELGEQVERVREVGVHRHDHTAGDRGETGGERRADPGVSGVGDHAKLWVPLGEGGETLAGEAVQHDHREVAGQRLLPQALEYLQPVHLGQLEIEQDIAFLRRLRRQHVEAGALENGLGQGANRRIVVHDEDGAAPGDLERGRVAGPIIVG